MHLKFYLHTMSVKKMLQKRALIHMCNLIYKRAGLLIILIFHNYFPQRT